MITMMIMIIIVVAVSSSTSSFVSHVVYSVAQKY